MEKNKKGAGLKIGGALLAGVAIGALAEILSDPKKSKQVKEHVSKLVKKGMALLEEGTGEAGHKLKDVLDVVSKDASSVYDLVKGEAQTLLKKGKGKKG